MPEPVFTETMQLGIVARAERKGGVMLSCKHSGIDIAYSTLCTTWG
jgi:hypothetical protein